MKKTLTAILLAGVLMVSLIGTATAAERSPANRGSATYSSTEKSPRAEETVWYYRTINGQMQMRLWSITYDVWLTDWINVEL